MNLFRCRFHDIYHLSWCCGSSNQSDSSTSPTTYRNNSKRKPNFFLHWRQHFHWRMKLKVTIFVNSTTSNFTGNPPFWVFTVNSFHRNGSPYWLIRLSDTLRVSDKLGTTSLDELKYCDSRFRFAAASWSDKFAG